MKYIITTDEGQQGWMDSFNNWNESNYKLGQSIKTIHAQEVKGEIDRFNNAVALGPAIILEEVSND
ncbi:MAG: hypothetical protein JJU16_05270 [Alkalibacterium sp.]|nr:hypothetical protein [Alkalibacterium sp.]